MHLTRYNKKNRPFQDGLALGTTVTLRQELAVTYQQGNVRIAFDNTGTGGAEKTRRIAIRLCLSN
ncbi:hypothetical protein [Mucilaginibacter rubeus]|uniref:Uncharacterized protein n=1 Tax=Mucilaginibacter rubeus TaxID=2027860 RepID=A0A5C1HTI6_9SPHI|nr:hypothetical protein [Mucilaginibacter rubeus]QEM09114.1 hypothetical protein DEO27_003475 [Mucilaginibacter rubeus]